MGLRAGVAARVRFANYSSGRIALSRRRRPGAPVRLPVRHGARRDAGQSPERPGPGPDTRIGMARHHAVTPTRREFCFSSAAALVGLSIKADRPVSGAFVNDDVAIGHLLRNRPPFEPAKTIE